MKKFTGSIIIAIIVVGLLIGCAAPAPAPAPKPAPAPSPAPAPAPSPTAAAKPVELKAVSVFPTTQYVMKSLFMLQDKVKEFSKGAVTINFLGGTEVIPQFEQAKQTAAGVVDLDFIFSAAYAGLVPGEGMLTVSRLSYAKEREVGFWALMNEMHKKANLYYLGRGASSYSDKDPKKFHILLKNKIQTPYDLAGKKIAGTSPASDAFLKALGAVSVVTTFAEYYSAGERGMVDGGWNGISSQISSGFYQTMKYYINHTYATDNLTYIINLDKWNSLSKSAQDVLTKAAIYVENNYPDLENEGTKLNWQKFKDAGIEFINFSPADAKWFVDLFYEAEWEKLLRTYPDVAPRGKALLTQ